MKAEDILKNMSTGWELHEATLASSGAFTLSKGKRSESVNASTVKSLINKKLIVGEYVNPYKKQYKKI